VGSLVLVHNSHIEKELNRKMKPHFLGPMVIVHRTQGGAYILAELNGSVSRLQYATFHIIPYLERFSDHMPVTALMDEAKLEDVQIFLESFPPANDPSKEVVLMNKFLLKSPPSLYPTISSCYKYSSSILAQMIPSSKSLQA